MLNLPKKIEYEIRMDIDNVPLTNKIRDTWYAPGPMSDFIEDLRVRTTITFWINFVP